MATTSPVMPGLDLDAPLQSPGALNQDATLDAEAVKALRIGVVTFPGTLDDRDALRAVRLTGASAVPLWHADTTLSDVDAVILPGGFSYGDYLRCGAIARFAPIVERVIDAANGGMPVLGICNGFQILCESHLLPGALLRNDHQRFICRDQQLVVENTDTAFTGSYQDGQIITVPLKNGEGQYVADPHTITELEETGRVVFRYHGFNPNGSTKNIAGITNAEGNVVGLMPHPEHAVEAGYGPDGAFGPRSGTDGAILFHSLIAKLLA